MCITIIRQLFFHRFRKGKGFTKGDKCVYCQEAIDAFITQGQRCIDCKQLYHTKCIQNKGVITMPCTSPATALRRGKYRKPRNPNSHSLLDQAKHAVTSNFNLTGTSEFMDRTDKIISDATELQAMQNFITEKIYKMESNENKKQSEVRRVLMISSPPQLMIPSSTSDSIDFESFSGT